MTEVELEREAVLADIRNAFPDCGCPEGFYGPCYHDEIIDEVYYLVKLKMESRSAESA